MKKIKYLLFIILCLIAYEVKAETVGLRHAGSYGKLVSKSEYWTGESPIKIYEAKYNDEKFVSFCRNPHLPSSLTTAGVSEQSSFHDIEFTVTELDETKPYDAGIIAILNSATNLVRSTGEIDLSVAANVNHALRIYEMMWKYDSNSCEGKEAFVLNYYRKKAKDYSNDSSIPKDGLDNLKKSFAYCETNVTSQWIDNYSEETVKSYVKKGFEAAVAAKKGNAEAFKVEVEESKIKNNQLNYTITLNGELKKNEDIKFKYSCSNCTNNINSQKMYVYYGEKTKEIKNLNEALSLKDYFKNNKKVEVRIVYDIKQNCTSINYNVEVEYPKSNTKVICLVPNSGIQAQYAVKIEKSQSMYGSQSERDTEKKTFAGKLLNCSCEDAKSKCDQGNTDVCEYFKKEHGGACAQCLPKISGAVCSSEDTTITIREGIKQTDDCSSEEIDIKECIINKLDINNNSYKDTKLVDDGNKYCGVYCKEDYDITVPGIKETESGRQFEINTKLKGTKSCYLSEVREDLFETDYSNTTNVLESTSKRISDILQTVIPNQERYIENLENTISSTTNQEEKQEREKDLEEAKEELTNLENELDTLIKSIKNNNKELEKIIKDYNSCASWENKMGFQANPEVYVEYYEQYTKLIKDKKLNVKSQKPVSVTETFKCRNVDSKYDKCTEGIGQEYITRNVTYYTVNGSGRNVTIKTNVETEKINKVKYMKKSMEYEIEHSVENMYCQKYTSGGVSFGECTAENLEKLYGLPVALNRKAGSYEFKIKFKNLGEFYSTGTLGRIWGADKSLIAEYKEKLGDSACSKTTDDFAIKKDNYVCKYAVDDELCTYEGVIHRKYECKSDETESDCKKRLCDGGTVGGCELYKCEPDEDGEYTVDTICKHKEDGTEKTLKELYKLYPGDGNCPKCPECEPDCEGEDCVADCKKQPNKLCCVNKDGTKYSKGEKITEAKYKEICEPCPGGECPVYISNIRNISFKPVSTGNVNPTKRTMGQNWRYDEQIDSAIELKASVTTKQIESSQEYIYDSEENDVNTKNRNIAVVVRLDGSLISKIKDYNKKAEKNGGYFNESLTCYDYEENGEVYGKIFCYSKFLDNVVQDKMQVIGGERPSPTSNRKLPGTYWTTWTKSNVEKAAGQNGIALTTVKELYFQNHYREVGVGPSWK